MTLKVDLGGATKAAASVGKIVAVVVLATVAIAVIAVFVSIRSAAPQVNLAVNDAAQRIAEIQRATASARQPVPPRVQKIAPSALATPTALGWRELDVPVPSSGWATFEPVTDLRWAMDIARAWQPDARLTRIDVDRLKSDGTVDLTAGPDNKAGYRFMSPGQIENWGRIADRDAKAEVPYAMMLQLVEQKVTALVTRGQPRNDAAPPVTIDSHPLPELLNLALKRRGFKEHPFYSGYMIHLPGEGWVWYLSSLSNRESQPRVRARDGATYPYGR